MSISLDNQQLFDAANRLIHQFVNRCSAFEMFTELNEQLLAATDSEYGFIGRIYRNEKGPYLKTLALSNIAWNEDTRKLYAEQSRTGMEFGNMQTLFGHVITSGRPLITHDAPHSPLRGGIPAGHPPLNTFLGIPIQRDNVMIGMVGLANGSQYSEQLVADLRPLLSTVSEIMFAICLQDDLIPESSYFREPQAVLSTLAAGILSTDPTGVILSANRAVSKIFGYPQDGLTGMQLQHLIPPAGEGGLYTDGSSPGIDFERIDSTFEATAIRKNGEYFPVEISSSAVDGPTQSQLAFVIHDISERKRIEKIKNDCFSTVSHELRTPLTAIHTSLGMLTEDGTDVGDEESQFLIQMANRNCERLVDLVNNILDLEKLNAGQTSMECQPFDASTVIRGAIEMTHAIASKKKIVIELDMPAVAVQIAGQSGRIMQVLVNLLSNAIRVSEPYQTIRISCQRQGELLCRFSVHDEGCGISAQDMGIIFDPFQQVDSDASGAGLGLAICRKIVEQHDGVIDCLSELDQGSTFFFDLFVYQDLERRPTHADQSAPKTILWVDSDDHIVGRAKQEINRSDFRFQAASNTQIAKYYLNAHPVDLLILGNDLFNESADALVSQIRAHDEFRELPIVIFSNDIDPQLARHFSSLGVDLQLKKSHGFQQLTDYIGTLIVDL